MLAMFSTMIYLTSWLDFLLVFGANIVSCLHLLQTAMYANTVDEVWHIVSYQNPDDQQS